MTQEQIQKARVRSTKTQLSFFAKKEKRGLTLRFDAAVGEWLASLDTSIDQAPRRQRAMIQV